jgi:hypothetical protein
VIWVGIIAACVLGLIVMLCAAALVEVFRQLADLRFALNLQDEPTPIGLRSGELRTDAIGLPEEIAAQPNATVIFLSPKCSTCLAIAEAFREGSPADVWFLVPSNPAPLALASVLAESSDRLVIDFEDAISDRIGLHVTPSVFLASYGDILRAYAVSTPRQVRNLIPTTLPRDPDAAASASPLAVLGDSR